MPSTQPLLLGRYYPGGSAESDYFDNRWQIRREIFNNFTNLLYNNMKISNTKSVVLVRAVFVNLYCQAGAWLHPCIVVIKGPSVLVASGIIV